MPNTRATHPDKVAWLVKHADLWKKNDDLEGMLDSIARGFAEAGLVTDKKNVSDASTLKLITKAAKQLREEALARR